MPQAILLEELRVLAAERLSQQEIAARLGMTLAALRQALYRARAAGLPSERAS